MPHEQFPVPGGKKERADPPSLNEESRADSLKAYRTLSGIDIRISPHLSAHRDVLPHIPAILEKIDFSGNPPEIKKIIPLDGVVGKKTLVSTGPLDEGNIVYAKRTGRRIVSRFVKDRVPSDVSSVAVILEKDRESDGYFLVTAYFGDEFPEPETGDKNRFAKQGSMAVEAEQASIAYWKDHAFCYDIEKERGGIDLSSESAENRS